MIPNLPTIGRFTTDAALRVQAWDPWLAQSTGLAAGKACGQTLASLFPELTSRGLLTRLQRVVLDGTVEILSPALHKFLLACPTAAPSRRFGKMQQRVEIVPLREGDRVTGCLVTIEDVTARLDHERDLAEQLASGDESARLHAASEFAASDGEAPAELVRAIGDESWRVRRSVVDGLARRADADTVAQLLRSMREQHQDASVLNSTLSALALSNVDVVAPLTELLSDPDPDLRIYVALALGVQRDARAVAPLIGALSDENENVRFHAIEALGRLRDPEAVNALVAVAESRDFFLAFPALDTLARIGDPAAALRILPLLGDEVLCAPAAEALGHLGDEQAVAPLANLLNSPGAPAIVIAQALAALQDRYEKNYREGSHIADVARRQVREEGAALLIATLEKARVDEMSPLVRVLGWIDDTAARRALAGLIARPQVAREVIEALVRHGSRVTGVLIEQLRAPASDTRQAAVVALARIGDPLAVPALVKLMHESSGLDAAQPEDFANEPLTILAAGALAKIGDCGSFEGLIELFAHPSAAVRQAAIAGLNSIGHPGLGERIEILLGVPNPHIRESAARVAGYFGYAACTESLFRLCDDTNENVRRAAVESLPFLEDPRIPGRLTALLRTGSPRVRAAAAQAVAHLDTAAALGPLLVALGDSDAWVRYYAARALGQHGAPESLELLARIAQNDEAQHVRAAAVEAIGRLGGARGVALLAPFVDSGNDDLVRAALHALGRISHPDSLAPLLSVLLSTHPERRIESIRALGERGGDGVAEALHAAAAGDRECAVQHAAITALAEIATPESIAAIITLATASDPRETCIAALAHCGGKHLESVARGLVHPQEAARRAVVEALARIKSEPASEHLCRALDDASPAVRAAAATALGHLGSREAGRRLAQMARTDADPSARRAAHDSLKRETAWD